MTGADKKLGTEKRSSSRCILLPTALGISTTCSVDTVGTYAPLGSGFNYQKLGVTPKPVSAYK